MTRKWRVCEPSSLRIIDYEDGAVLFDRRSGQTHIVNALAAEAFNALLEGHLTRDQLIERMREAIEGEPRGDLARAVDAVIKRLDILGLIAQVDA